MHAGASRRREPRARSACAMKRGRAQARGRARRRRHAPRAGRCSATPPPGRRASSCASTSSPTTARATSPAATAPRPTRASTTIMRERGRALPDRRRCRASPTRPARPGGDGRPRRSTTPSARCCARAARATASRSRSTARPPHPPRRAAPALRARSGSRRTRSASASTAAEAVLREAGARRRGSSSPPYNRFDARPVRRCSPRATTSSAAGPRASRARLPAHPAVARRRRLPARLRAALRHGGRGRCRDVERSARAGACCGAGVAALGLGGRRGWASSSASPHAVAPLAARWEEFLDPRATQQPSRVKIVCVMTTDARGGAEFAAVEMLDALAGARPRGRAAHRPARASAAARACASRPIDLGPKLAHAHAGRSSRCAGRSAAAACARRSQRRGALRRAARPLQEGAADGALAARAPARRRSSWAEWGPVPFPMRRACRAGCTSRRRAGATVVHGRLRRARRDSVWPRSACRRRRSSSSPTSCAPTRSPSPPRAAPRVRAELGIPADAFVVGLHLPLPPQEAQRRRRRRGQAPLDDPTARTWSSRGAGETRGRAARARRAARRPRRTSSPPRATTSPTSSRPST